MELSNLINGESKHQNSHQFQQPIPQPYYPQHHHNRPSSTAAMNNTNFNGTNRFPTIQQPHPQQQHIKLPSIHEIINISQLGNNATVAQNSQSSSSSTPVSTPPNYHYQPQPMVYHQQQQPILHQPISSTSTTTTNSNSPLQSVIHSPIDSPIYHRSSSASSVDSTNSFQYSKYTSTTASSGSGKIISRSQNGRKGRSNLPKKTTMILLDWLYKNINHPYPSPKQKSELIYQTGLSSQQLSNWFINARRRKIRSLKFQEEEKFIL